MDGDDARSARILAVRSGTPSCGRRPRRRSLTSEQALSESRASRRPCPARGGHCPARNQAETYTGEITPGLLERGARSRSGSGWSSSGTTVRATRSAAVLMRAGGDRTARASCSRARGRDGGERRRRLPSQAVWWLACLEWSRRPLADGRSTTPPSAYELTDQTQHRTCSSSGSDGPRRSSRRTSASSTTHAPRPRRRSRPLRRPRSSSSASSPRCARAHRARARERRDGRQLPARPARTAARGRDERPHPHGLGGRNRDARSLSASSSRPATTSSSTS